MIKIGEYNTLRIDRDTGVGLFLTDDEGNDVLLPNKYVPEEFEIEDKIQVFIYRDSEDRIVATDLKPLIKAGEYAYLRVKEVNDYGAFLDWGLEKDLLVPFRNQARRMQVDKSYIVHAYVDEQTDRLVASSKTNKFINEKLIALTPNQEVDLLVCGDSDLGVNVIVNNRYKGLIYHNELFQPLYPGNRIKGYVKLIREDHKIDISLQKQGYDNIEPNAQKILTTLKQNQGILSLHDKSDPDAIYQVLKMSKKTFKKAIGMLYKQKLITLENDHIKLN